MNKNSTYELKYIFLCLIISITMLHSQDSLIKRNDFFQFYFMSGVIANNSFSNLSNLDINGQPVNTGNYVSNAMPLPNLSVPVCFGYNVGLNILIGRLEFLKQIIGIDFSCTNSMFKMNTQNWSHYQSGYGSNYSETTLNKREVFFIGINYGIRLIIQKHLTFSIIPTLNIPIKTTNVKDGYWEGSSQSVINQQINISYGSGEIHTTSVTKNNALYLSVKIQCGYNFKIKSQRFHVYISKNFGLRNNQSINLLRQGALKTYLAPWLEIGIQYSPVFKK